MQTIYVPTLNDTPSDYIKLFKIWQQVWLSPSGAAFDFSRCHFLRPNAVAFLGGLARHAQHAGKPISFLWDSLQPAIFANLCQNGFAQAFGYGQPPWDGHSIPYREDKHDRMSDPVPILDYLTDQWIRKEWLNISEMLRDAIACRVWEIYTNSLEHAGSPTGVFSCGQHFKNGNELVLSVVDFGAGIPSKVRGFLRTDPRSQTLQASACMEWAFKRGNSTTVGVPRGLGLDLLREFVRLNNGSLEVYSEDGYAVIKRDNESYHTLPSGFSGTAVQIKLICDTRSYRFANEPAPQN
ncbi:ATP-binding protein [Burkholderia contaminans]|uniref:ATP-binding protein n=1 Tax=Burkholderia contaminans TaxID=488447 RepID=A0A3N8RC07_9BURK|nr:ATP-binding protein [Burkholderia contaminans]RQT33415.1 ATP-binding protein [Burkholderia contaminans]